jgi:hypothetical protein
MEILVLLLIFLSGLLFGLGILPTHFSKKWKEYYIKKILEYPLPDNKPPDQQKPDQDKPDKPA